MTIKLNLSGHFNQSLADAGYTFPGALQVDLADPQLDTKLVDFLIPLVGDGSQPVQVVLPGLAPLAARVLVIIHALTGNFPVMGCLVRGQDGAFVPGPDCDLQSLRNDISRVNRHGIVVL